MTNGLLEQSYQSTYRETDEHLLISALGSMQLRLAVKEAAISFSPSNFFNATHGKIWDAAKQLAESDKMMFIDNFRPLLGKSEMRVLELLHGRPVRPVEFEAALRLVRSAAQRRILNDGLRRIAARIQLEDEYGPCLASAHEVLTTLEQTEVSSDSTTLAETISDFWEQVENPVDQVAKMSTPWPSLDERFLRGGIGHGQLVTCMAPSGGGKSVWALQLAGHWAARGRKVAIFSLEMDRKDVTDRILASQSATNIGSVADRKITADDEVRLINATDLLANDNVHIFDAADMTMKDVRQQCATLQRVHGLDAVIIDYIQIVNPDREDRDKLREQQVSEIARQMKLLASTGVAVITASQMAAANERPTKESTRESRAIVHHSDLVIALFHDPTKPGEVDMCVVKNRRGPETGPDGGLLMLWRANKSSIDDPTV